jgi:hypothetical protein
VLFRVSARAVVEQINRSLESRDRPIADAGRVIRRGTRGQPARSHLGDVYLMGICRNAIFDHHVGAEEFARKLNGFLDWEEVEEESSHA